ncbi:hypothetical protein V2W45_1338739 [Cenococcum geophilum]
MPDKELRLLALGGSGVIETINPDLPPKPYDYSHMIWGNKHWRAHRNYAWPAF